MRNAAPMVEPSGAAQFGTSRRHSSPPPAERTRGTGEQPVPAYTAPCSRHPSPPAGGKVGRGAAERSAAPRSGLWSPSADPQISLELAALDRTVMRLLIIEDDRDAADYIAR